jgi:2-iminobutanoate/2-iminopropanoate deaminase
LSFNAKRMKYIVSIFSFMLLVSCNSTNRVMTNNPADLSKPIGPYSYSTRYKDLVFISGQIGIDPLTNTLKQGIEEQTIQIFENLKVILTNNGSDLNHITKTTIFLTDINQFESVNKIYSRYFLNQFPARSTVAVVALAQKAKIEIECVAVKK